ncbi:unnamed protein product, partial [Ectocarpus fasciculatus]
MKRLIRPIHIAGANGFPISLYRPLMDRLSEQLHARQPAVPIREVRSLIAGSDVYGHIANYPDWTGMVNHLITDIEKREVGAITAVGHSLGGALMGCAASQRPDLFHKLIIIDSPFFCLPKRLFWALLLMLPESTVRTHHPIIKAAAKKPSHWSTKEEARAYFKSKRVFQRFSPEVLDIFLEECLVGDAGNTTLQFPVEDECDIYYKASIELKFHRRKYFGMHDFPHKAEFFYSKDHHIVTAMDIMWMKYLDNPNITFRHYEGSHFWPFEHPAGCAESLAQ